MFAVPARTLPLAVATLLALLATAVPAHAGLKAIWGPTTMPDGTSAFPVYQRLGVDVLQEQLQWDSVAPQRPANPTNPGDPAYRWPAELQRTIDGASGAGIRVLLMVKQAPGWANGGRHAAWAPNDPVDFANFLTAAARRYPAVRHWMIWGEPDKNMLPMDANSKEGPRVYARLLDAAYGALKGVSGANVVIGGNTWTNSLIPPRRWLKWSRLPDGKPPRLDWYGHNPFSFRLPDLSKDVYHRGVRDMSDLDVLRGEVNRAYRSRGVRPRLWLSEFTVMSGKDSSAFRFHVSRRGQARYVKAAYKIARRNSWIAGLGWWKLLDDPPAPGSRNAGLLTADGVKKPAYRAFRRAR
jgi:hypothetical protein